MELLSLTALLPEWAQQAAILIGIVATLLTALHVFFAAVAAAMRALAEQVPLDWGIALVRCAAATEAVSDWCGDASANVLQFVGWLRQIPPARTPPAVLLLLILFCLPLTACAGSLQDARAAGRAERIALATSGAPVADNRAHCEAVDARYQTWSAIAKGGAALTGGAGISTLPVEDNSARMGLAIGAAVAGAITAAAVAAADGAAAEFARECQ